MDSWRWILDIQDNNYTMHGTLKCLMHSENRVFEKEKENYLKRRGIPEPMIHA
jgi:hypothetical protein